MWYSLVVGSVRILAPALNNYINMMMLSIIIFAKMLSLRALHDIAIVTFMYIAIYK